MTNPSPACPALPAGPGGLPSLRHHPSPLGWVAMLGLSCIVLGAIGIYMGIDAWLSPPSTGGSVQEELLKGLGGASPEERQALESFMKNDATKQLLEQMDGAAGGLIPNRGLYDVSSFILSLLSLAAGIGTMMRREWGRLLMIAFIALATLALFYFTYTMIEPLAGMLVQFGGTSKSATAPATSRMASSFTGYWALLCGVFLLLHGGIIFFLCRPRIKETFRKS
jgi:hypothetical protein